MKNCTKCKIEKKLTEFWKDKCARDGLSFQCKECRNKQKKEYRLNNKNKIKEHNKEYRLNNKDKINKHNKEYRLNNKDKKREYLLNRYKTDSDYRLLANLRSRIWSTIKNNTKSTSTKKLIGITIEELKIHLQKTAIKNGYIDFDINNYSGEDYHIDHIKPCASFDLSKESEQRKCFHYSNLQILTAEENLIKSDSY